MPIFSKTCFGLFCSSLLLLIAPPLSADPLAESSETAYSENKISIKLNQKSTEEHEENKISIDLNQKSDEENKENKISIDLNQKSDEDNKENTISIDLDQKSTEENKENTFAENTSSLDQKLKSTDLSSENKKTPFSHACFFELRGSFFIPTGTEFKHTYHGTALWGVEIDFRLYKYLYGWASVNYFHQSGHTTLHKPTKLTMIPLNTGLKFLYTLYCVQPYLGIGFEPTYFHEETSDPTLVTVLTDWSYGGIFKAGFICFEGPFLIDIFADYSLRWAHINHLLNLDHSVNVSGLSFGAAIGWGF